MQKTLEESIFKYLFESFWVISRTFCLKLSKFSVLAPNNFTKLFRKNKSPRRVASAYSGVEISKFLLTAALWRHGPSIPAKIGARCDVTSPSVLSRLFQFSTPESAEATLLGDLLTLKKWQWQSQEHLSKDRWRNCGVILSRLFRGKTFNRLQYLA